MKKKKESKIKKEKKVNGWKKIFHSNSNQKREGMAILILAKIDFKSYKTKETKRHYILIKGSVQQEDKTIINIYTPNNRLKIHEAKWIEQTVLYHPTCRIHVLLRFTRHILQETPCVRP